MSGFVLHGSGAKAEEKKLAAEAARIPVPATARRVKHRSGSQPRQAHVEDTFRGPLPYDGLRAHYDTALAARGWTFEQDRPLKDWGRDLGGRVARYRKGDYLASLQLAGGKS